MASARQHLRRLRGPSLAVALATIGLAPGIAHAGSYAIVQCNDGAGHPAEVTSGFLTVVAGSASDGCPTGGRVELNLTPNTLAPFGSQDQQMGFSFELPTSMPNAKLTRFEPTIYVAPKTGHTTLSHGEFAIHEDNGYTAVHEGIPAGQWNGIPNVRYGADLPGGSRFARFIVSCYGPCDFQARPTVALGATRIVIDDPLGPEPVRFETNGLLDGTVQAGNRIVKYAASDADSGVQRVELHAADGTLLASSAAGEGCSFTRPAPCPQVRANQSLTLDTTRLPDGKQTLELWAADAAGNVRKTALPTVTIQNGTPTGTGGGEAGGGGEPAAAGAPKVTFKVSSTKPRRKAKVTFSGVVTPVPVPAGRVIIEAKSKKKWITAAIVRTRDGGKFTWSHRFNRRGTYTMRARLLTSVEAKTKPATSKHRVFRVR